jgi:hypothetical protein
MITTYNNIHVPKIAVQSRAFSLLPEVADCFFAKSTWLVSEWTPIALNKTDSFANADIELKINY